MAKVINLTPHPVVLTCDNGAVVTFKASGTVARVEIKQNKQMRQIEIVEGVVISIPVVVNEHSEVYGLPDPELGTYYIVSSMVATAVCRPDLFSPNTDSTAERDSTGRILGVKSFQQIFNTKAFNANMMEFMAAHPESAATK